MGGGEIPWLFRLLEELLVFGYGLFALAGILGQVSQFQPEEEIPRDIPRSATG